MQVLGLSRPSYCWMYSAKCLWTTVYSLIMFVISDGSRNVSAPSSFVANAHNELCAFCMGTRRLAEKNLRPIRGRAPPSGAGCPSAASPPLNPPLFVIVYSGITRLNILYLHVFSASTLAEIGFQCGRILKLPQRDISAISFLSSVADLEVLTFELIYLVHFCRFWAFLDRGVLT